LSVGIDFSAPVKWGQNATNGTLLVERALAAKGPFTAVSGFLSSSTTAFTDSTANPSTSYFYRIRATNNCPGTALTPMILNSNNGTITTTTCP
jgi:hypothetical protein